MVRLEFTKDGARILALGVCYGQPVQVDGDASRFDFALRPYSARLGRAVSFTEDAEEWARSLPSAYSDSPIRVQVLDDEPELNELDRTPDSSSRPSATRIVILTVLLAIVAVRVLPFILMLVLTGVNGVDLSSFIPTLGLVALIAGICAWPRMRRRAHQRELGLASSQAVVRAPTPARLPQGERAGATDMAPKVERWARGTALTLLVISLLWGCLEAFGGLGACAVNYTTSTTLHACYDGENWRFWGDLYPFFVSIPGFLLVWFLYVRPRVRWLLLIVMIAAMLAAGVVGQNQLQPGWPKCGQTGAPCPND